MGKVDGDDALPVLVVGAGKMGLLHGALFEASGRARVAAFSDPSLQARFVLKGLGIRTPSYKSFERALDRHDIAGACVCAPPQAHFPVAAALVERGVPVFVEKPLTTSAGNSRVLADLARREGVPGAVGYVRRFHKVFQALHGQLADGPAPALLRVELLSPQFAHIAAGAGGHRGGIEWDLLPHVVDTAMWLLDRSPDELRVKEASVVPGRSVRAVASAGDTRLELVADWTSTDVRKVEQRITAERGDGTALGCDESSAWAADEDGEKRTTFHVRQGEPPWFDLAGHEFSGQTMGILDAFEGRRSQSATLDDGAATDGAIARILEEAVARG